MKIVFKYEIIENFMKENNLSKTGFCKLCKVSYGVLKKIIEDKTNFSILSFCKIAKTINVKMSELIDN